MRLLISLLFLLKLYAFTDNQIYSEIVKSTVVVETNKKKSAGVIINAKGHVITNYHALAGSLDVFISLHDSDIAPYKASIIKVDKTKDLALIKIESDSYFDFINISKIPLEVGDSAFIVGHPNNYDWSFQRVFVSKFIEDHLWSYDSYELMESDIYQLQVTFNPGNSGGPLINNNGNLVGLNTFSAELNSGVGFSITSKEIFDFLRTNLEEASQ